MTYTRRTPASVRSADCCCCKIQLRVNTEALTHLHRGPTRHSSGWTLKHLHTYTVDLHDTAQGEHWSTYTPTPWTYTTQLRVNTEALTHLHRGPTRHSSGWTLKHLHTYTVDLHDTAQGEHWSTYTPTPWTYTTQLRVNTEALTHLHRGLIWHSTGWTLKHLHTYTVDLHDTAQGEHWSTYTPTPWTYTTQLRVNTEALTHLHRGPTRHSSGWTLKHLHTYTVDLHDTAQGEHWSTYTPTLWTYTTQLRVNTEALTHLHRGPIRHSTGWTLKHLHTYTVDLHDTAQGEHWSTYTPTPWTYTTQHRANTEALTHLRRGPTRHSTGWTLKHLHTYTVDLHDTAQGEHWSTYTPTPWTYTTQHRVNTEALTHLHRGPTRHSSGWTLKHLHTYTVDLNDTAQGDL